MSTTDWVLHVDLDQFIAAVEVARRPELRGRPVVVGGQGDPSRRGVVATASYEAREYGVHSGMPLRTAAKKCPECVFLAADRAAYERVSERVMATLREFPVVVEVMGWDEAFVGARTDDPEALAADLREAVLHETGLSCSVGIGDNKLRAKTATGFAKPDGGLPGAGSGSGSGPGPGSGSGSGSGSGVYRLTHENWAAVMAGRPTDALWGIGARTSKKLAEMGLHTVADLGRADRATLAERFGPKMGPYFWLLAQGAGDTEVTATPHVPKGHSREVTFQENIAEPAELAGQVRRLARHVAQDVAGEGRPAARVGLKIRYAPFITKTRSITLPAPTGDPEEIERAALEVFTLLELDRPVRLLGVRVEFVEDATGPQQAPAGPAA